MRVFALSMGGRAPNIEQSWRLQLLLATSCNESNLHPAKPLHYARYRWGPVTAPHVCHIYLIIHQAIFTNKFVAMTRSWIVSGSQILPENVQNWGLAFGHCSLPRGTKKYQDLLGCPVLYRSDAGLCRRHGGLRSGSVFSGIIGKIVVVVNWRECTMESYLCIYRLGFRKILLFVLQYVYVYFSNIPSVNIYIFKYRYRYRFKSIYTYCVHIWYTSDCQRRTY